MSNQERIRILCVEDHPLMRAGIAVVINGQADMELVAQASNGREAIKCFCEYKPDVTLMDLTLSDMSGIDVMIAIHTRFPEARVIISSTFLSAVQIKRAMAAGARSYILKNMSPIEVAAAIHRVHAGKKHIPMDVATHLAEHFDDEALSEREIEVLRHVSAGNSNKIIADVLNLSEHTVKGHLKNILSKLGANDRTHAVMIALRRRLLACVAFPECSGCGTPRTHTIPGRRNQLSRSAHYRFNPVSPLSSISSARKKQKHSRSFSFMRRWTVAGSNSAERIQPAAQEG